MHASYDDIRSRIDEKPTWWDSNGVPRYGEFVPGMSPNIYADEVVLLLIRCQSCQEHFRVELHSARSDVMHGHLLCREKVRRGFIHYGDAPWHLVGTGQCAGTTMNSEPERVLQFWARHHRDGWERVPELEKAIECDWAEGGG